MEPLETTKRLLVCSYLLLIEVFCLGFEPVTKENANTLLDLSVSVLTRQSDCSRPISVDSPDDVFKNILSSITSIMTDRAAVMKPFVRKMQDYLESELGGKCPA